MAILAECPVCHKKQATKNRRCSCGEDIVKAKRSKRVKYWIVYRLPNGKQRKELVTPNPYSIEEAKTAEGKRRAQKHENPSILEKAVEEKKTFKELSQWYLKLKSVQKLRSHKRVEQCFNKFNKVFGNITISKIKPLDLEEYQNTRDDEGAAPATIDMELTIVKSMIVKAFDNDKVSGNILKVFRSYKRKLKKGANVRKRIITVEEFTKLLQASSTHLKPILIVAYNTGMRFGEIQSLLWAFVDKNKKFIRLPKEVTKEKKPKNIPMNQNVMRALDSLPRALHHDFVFTSSRGTPLCERSGLRKPFITACKKAQIPYGRGELDGVIFHDIRRTVKTNMLKAGVDKIYRDIIFGHSLTGMDIHYIVPSEDDLHRAMAKYTDWLNRQIDSMLPKTLPKNKN